MVFKYNPITSKLDLTGSSSTDPTFIDSITIEGEDPSLILQSTDGANEEWTINLDGGSFEINRVGVGTAFSITSGTQQMSINLLNNFIVQAANQCTFISDFVQFSGANIVRQSSTENGSVSHVISNGGSLSTSSARLVLGAADAAGDAYINFSIGSASDWSAGVDNSDSDKFKITRSEFLNANDVLTIDDNDLVTVEALQSKRFNETKTTLSGTSPDVDLDLGTVFSLTLSGNSTFTFSNAASAGLSNSFVLQVQQDAGASGYTVTWPASVEWPGGVAPTLTATANAVDVFVFITYDGGTTWYGFVSGQDMS